MHIKINISCTSETEETCDDILTQIGLVLMRNKTNLQAFDIEHYKEPDSKELQTKTTLRGKFKDDLCPICKKTIVFSIDGRQACCLGFGCAFRVNLNTGVDAGGFSHSTK